MVARILIGQKGSDYGIWVSQPGVDVVTATDSQLLLGMTIFTDQIIINGIASGTQDVPLGLSARPFVLISARGALGADPVSTRPSPMGTSTLNCSITSSASVLNINAPQQIYYSVFRRAF